MNTAKLRYGLALCCWAACHIALAQDDRTASLAAWLDVPPGWSRSVDDGVVAVTPNDLSAGASLLILVEPPAERSESLDAAYARALNKLGPWRPAGNAVEQKFDTGWVFRFGVGVAELNGMKYTGQVAVAQRGDQQARFWVLADSDATFNRYQAAIGTAISSVQDSTLGASATASAAAARPASTPPPSRSAGGATLDPAFGQGLSGAYVGLERGLTASAGAGAGVNQTFNQSTGRFETNTSAATPGVQTSIADYAEIDLLFPDGTYRRRLPARGLASDLAWDRATFPTWWGRWSRQGDVVVTERGSYRTTYRISGDALLSERDRAWVKLPLAKELRIAGSFARADYDAAAAPRLVFYADGRYEDRGGFMRMIGSSWNLVVPEDEAQARQAMGPGAGTYAFGDFTLTLSDRDGRVWQVGVYIPPGQDVRAPQQLVVNGRALMKDSR